MSIPFMICMLTTSSSGPPRPTSYTESLAVGGKLTNPTYAYDTINSPPDISTYAALQEINGSTSGTYQSYAIYTGIGTINGTLHIAISTATQNIISSNGINEAISSAEVDYSKDGGSTWSTVSIATGGTNDFVNTTPLTVSLTGVTGDVQVKIIVNGQYVYSSDPLAVANAGVYANIYDIWML